MSEVTEPARVIVLNGPSSAGKSSVGFELQRLLDSAPLYAQLDYFLAMLPPVGHIGMSWSQRTNENADGDDAPLRWIFPDEPGGPVRIEVREQGQRIVRGMHRTVAALARAGDDVILEHVTLYEEWVADLAEALDGLDRRLQGRGEPGDLRRIDRRGEGRRRGVRPRQVRRGLRDSDGGASS